MMTVLIECGKFLTRPNLHRCYLGNFRTSQTVSSSTAQVSAYILKANVASMTTKLFPHPWDVAQNVWTTHKETTVTGVTTEAVCQGVAALYHAVPVDYYVYSGTDCHLGDLSKSVGASGDATQQSVRIRTSNPRLPYINVRIRLRV